MSLKFFMLVLSVMINNPIVSQNALWCEKKQLLWCGVDFSLARFMGTFAVAGNKAKLTPQELKGYFEIWNNRIVNETDKVNFSSCLGFQQTIQAIEITKKTNNRVDSSKMILFEYYNIKEGQIDSVIKTYDIHPGQRGLGLSFIVEYLDKVHTQASMYAVFFNVETKQVVFKQKITSEPAGVGQSNYWLNAFLRAFTWIETKGNKEWEKTYCKP
jgi:hypothetical protein